MQGSTALNPPPLSALSAIVGVAAGVATLSLRDPEASRLAALLESARAEARAAGIVVTWQPVDDSNGDRFRSQCLRKRVELPKRWLGERVNVEIAGASVQVWYCSSER